MTARGTELTKSINFETDSLISSCSEKNIIDNRIFQPFPKSFYTRRYCKISNEFSVQHSLDILQ